MIEATLPAIKDFLIKQNMNCCLIPKSEAIPFDQLYAAMDIDEQGRDLVLFIRVSEEDQKENYHMMHLPVPHHNNHNIHLLVPLPFQIDAQFTSEVARLVLIINKSSAFLGFEFSEADKTVYFRSLIMTTNKIDPVILMSAIGNIMISVVTFANILEKVGKGEMSLTDIENAIKERSERPQGS